MRKPWIHIKWIWIDAKYRLESMWLDFRYWMLTQNARRGVLV